jgi:phosphoribosylglycinamide formyltransferase-1
MARDGWFEQRSTPFAVRSSVGMAAAYAAVLRPPEGVVASESMETRIAVLVSGSGTNLQTLLDDPAIRPHVALVLSDRPGVPALDRARDAGVEGAVIEPGGFGDRSDFDLEVLLLLEDRRIDTLVSAGYMRLLGKRVLDVYGGRWLNVHPSLLPSFPGMHGVRDALAYGVKVTGVTVFLVDEGVDTGPIVSQEVVDVLPDDDWDSLEARIHAAEHRQLPAAVRALIEGRLQPDGRRVRVREPDRD